MCTQPLQWAPSCFISSQHNPLVSARSSFVLCSLLLSVSPHHHGTNLLRKESTLLLLITLLWRHQQIPSCWLQSTVSNYCVTKQESSQSHLPCLGMVHVWLSMVAVDHVVIHTNHDWDKVFKKPQALCLKTKWLCSRLLCSVNLWVQHFQVLDTQVLIGLVQDVNRRQ